VKTNLADSAIQLLRELIAIPSFSREETEAANAVARFFEQRHIPIQRKGNNTWAKTLHWDSAKPTLLLNSHIDTVKPVAGWQRDPINPGIENGILYGLGSNDAGASLVALMAVFVHFYEKKDLPFNLILAATAEEEISGANGIAAILPDLGTIDAAIVGEPTEMQMAIAEKGLMVVDALAVGQAGHAAREEGINAIYLALKDIQTIQSLELPKISPLLGKVKFSVTQIEAGKQHNVVPDACLFVIDIRTNECYRNEEVFQLLQNVVRAELTARSFRLNSSGIALDHPLVKSGLAMELSYYGSPTLSDQALMPFPSLKMGCGHSARSHTADEFIYLDEIKNAIPIYIQLLEQLHWPFEQKQQL
jgi:acetylornithine deacetylase